MPENNNLENNTENKMNSKNTMYIIGGVIVALLILGLIAYMFSMRKDEDNKSSSTTSSSSSSMMMSSSAMMMSSNNSAMMMNSSMMMMNSSMPSVMVGGAAMLPSKNIVENASAASNLTTLVTALKAADLVTTLQGPGPFTVFAPSNEAFAKLPAGTLDTLLKPESKAKLQDTLKYHVVSGKLTAADLKDGQMLTTVQGDKLTVMIKDGKVMIKDAKGGMATVQTPNAPQSNGVVHVIDAVLSY